MRILIVGYKGQLGKEIVSQLSKCEDYTLFFSDYDDCDISDLDSVIKLVDRIGPELIVNCAAYTAVDDCESNHDTAYKVNAIGPRNLAIASSTIGSKIMHVSTDYVFNGDGEEPYTEYDFTGPVTVYGKTKLFGELEVIKHNPRHFILRTAWLYGEGKNFLNTMVELSQKHSTIRVVNDQIGSPTSTYELVQSMISLIDTQNYGLFHATCEGSCSWYEFTKEIFRLKEIDVEVIPCSSDEYIRPAKRPKYSVLRNYMFELTNGYKFKDWKDALYDYIQNEDDEVRRGSVCR